jgi:hypothetical protein
VLQRYCRGTVWIRYRYVHVRSVGCLDQTEGIYLSTTEYSGVSTVVFSNPYIVLSTSPIGLCVIGHGHKSKV